MKEYKLLSHKVTSIKRPLAIALAILSAVVVCIILSETTNRTHFFHDKPSPVSDTVADSHAKGELKKDGANKNKGEPALSEPSEINDSKKPGGTDTDTPLRAPSGDFVSSHRVGKNNMVSSVCTTTVGAKCQLLFTKDGTTKSLEATATDVEGNVYWDWKPSDLDLTSGTWDITAKATLGSQTEITNDVIQLEVTNE